MSFTGYKKMIEFGDTVIVFLGRNLMYSLKIEKDKVFQTKFGALKHNDLVGTMFGSKVACSKGWLYILYPTPELWTITLPHRTQILYSPDISLITFQLDLKPGSVICEAGTGSGSLSHALARTVYPSGHLYTFDFHAPRVEMARQEFEDHGFSDIVSIEHRDVCQNGFGLENIADAIFLDLPTPWLVIPSAKLALKLQGGRLCSFSPCIEQVQKTCEVLESHGFNEISTMECVARPFEVRHININIPDLGFNLSKDGSILYPALDSDEEEKSEMTSQNIGEGDSSVKDTNSSFRNSTYFKNFITAVPPLEITGHSGYLTFCTLYPTIRRNETTTAEN